MKKFWKILIPALILVIIVVVLAIFMSAETGEVIYIASNGTGDGTKPGEPLGNDSGYSAADKTYAKNALYRAFQKINEDTSNVNYTIVLVDDVVIDTADRMDGGPAEFKLLGNDVTVTLTSVYNGVDYRTTNEAKLILDHSSNTSPSLRLQSKTIWKDLDIQYKYSSTTGGKIQSLVSYGNGFIIQCGGYETVFDTGIRSTSHNVATSSEGDRFPVIYGGNRFGSVDSSNITINSGKWQNVLGCGAGIASSSAKINKNVSITVNGGEIETIHGAGLKSRLYSKVDGNVSITVNGGNVTEIKGNTSLGIKGTLTINVGENAVVGKITADDGATQEGRYTPSTKTVNAHANAINKENIVGFETSEVTYYGNRVVYVSSNGTGDGRTPSNPMGSGSSTMTPAQYDEKIAGYAAATKDNDKDKLVSKHALYKAVAEIEKYSENAGTIVVVGDLKINVSGSYDNGTCADFILPTSSKTITITSVYDGSDYRANAKVILDHSVWKSHSLQLNFKSVWKEINIEYQYNDESWGTWLNTFMIQCNGKETVFDEGIVCTSKDTENNKTGTIYPSILGGGRFSPVNSSKVTIKSGKWSYVTAAGHGMSSSTHGDITGNASVTVTGGDIGTLYGAGSSKRSTGSVAGDVLLDIKGGNVTQIIGNTGGGIKGSLTINVEDTATVNNIRADDGVAHESGCDNPTCSVNIYVDSLLGSITEFAASSVKVNGSKVIFIASNGTGDGRTPETPLGNVAGYKDKLNALDKGVYVDNALYRAFKKISRYGSADAWKIVFVGNVALDSDSSLRQSPGDLNLPATKGVVTVTSVHDGVDYREYGAQLILDHSQIINNTTIGSPILTMNGETVWENLDMVYYWHDSVVNHTSRINHEKGFMFICNGYKTVFGEGINTYSVRKYINGSDNNAHQYNYYDGGDAVYYPSIFGGHRYSSSLNKDTNVTVKSGRWNVVSGACHGLSSTNPGTLKGNISVTVEGGWINSLHTNGGLTSSTNYSAVDGNATITVNGGIVDKIYGLTGKGVSGTLSITVGPKAVVRNLTYKYSSYSGSAEPTSVSLKYDLAAISSSKVKGFAESSVTTTGSAKTVSNVLYVSNIGSGLQDGSSADNAIGHSSGYEAKHKWAIDYIANSATNSSKDGYYNCNKIVATSIYKQSALYRALVYKNSDNKSIVGTGGTIVVCGELSINANDRMTTSFGEFTWPTSSNNRLTITSVYGGVDYRTTGAKLVLDQIDTINSIYFKQPITFDKLVIEHKYDSSKVTDSADHMAMLSFFGKPLIVESDVVVNANDIKGQKKYYPTILGAERYGNRQYSTNITIKSGSWGRIYGASYGFYDSNTSSDLKGNVSINIEGGYVQRIVGTCREAMDVDRTFTVEGNVTINVIGGEVEQLYGSNCNGIKGEGAINVNIGAGAKVGIAHSYYYTGSNSGNKPANSTITFDRSAIYDANIKYFTNVNGLGDTVIYIADEAKGKGDGSSPENALGNAADYTDTRNEAFRIIAEAGGYGNAYSDANKRALINSVYTKTALYRALEKAKVANTGKVYLVVVDKLTIQDGDRMESTANSEAYMPTLSNHVTITSVYGGTDYRNTGKLVFDITQVKTSLMFHSDVTIENINIEHKYDSSKISPIASEVAMIGFTGHKAVIGENVKVTALDQKGTATVELFPTLIGNYRYTGGTAYNNANTDITIKSGSWGWVYGANYGAGNNAGMTGNVNVTVDGGYVGQIVGTCRETPVDYTVTGNVTIKINGGKVATLYATNRNGVGSAANKVEVTIENGALVNKAWGFYYTASKANKEPVNSYITYDRSAILEKNVDYFANVTATGTGAPDDTVIYIADEAKGTGDGSSPENAMGNAADYATLRQEALALIAEKDGFDNIGDAKNWVSQVYKKSALYLALDSVKDSYGNIVVVVVDKLTINAGDRMERSSNSDAFLPETVNGVTLTSVYGGVDYRTQGAKLVLDITEVRTALTFDSDITIDNIVIEHVYDSSKLTTVNAGSVAMIGFAGHKVVIGENVEVIATDESKKVEIFPALTGNYRYTSDTTAYRNGNTDITIKSGSWGWVYGANYGAGTNAGMTGNVNVTVDGGYVGQLVGTCREDDASKKYTVTGNVTIKINGGEVAKLYASNHNGLSGTGSKINVTIGENAEVGIAHSYYYTGSNSSNKPANSTITFYRSVIYDADVKYFTNMNGLGDTVIYIADEAKGKGDGSSPENALGNAADYAELRAQAIELIKNAVSEDGKTVGYGALTSEQQNWVSKVYEKSALYLALSKASAAKSNKVYVVVADDLTISAGQRMSAGSADSADVFLPSISIPVTLTSVYGGVDYRSLNDAKMIFDIREVRTTLMFNSDITIDDIVIEHVYDSSKLSGTMSEKVAAMTFRGHKGVIGENVEVVAKDMKSSAKIELYPMLVGNHRYGTHTLNTNMTIKSGKWGYVYGATYGTSGGGNMTGNVTITVEGGYIGQIVGSNKEFNTTSFIDGNVTIVVKGGKVSNLYGVNHNGVAKDSNKIEVTIENGALVGRAWGFYYTPGTADKEPVNSYITYDRTAILEKNVDYFANVTATGTGAPDDTVIYIADEAKGTGDGSSPENAMGNSADYATLRQEALALIAEKGGFDNIGDAKNWVSQVYKESALYRALNAAKDAVGNVVIVVVDDLTINAGERMSVKGADSADAIMPSFMNNVTLTSVYGGVDYRSKNDAKMIFDIREVRTTLMFNSDITIEDIVIEHVYDSSKFDVTPENLAMIAFKSHKAVIGENVEVIATDKSTARVALYPSLVGNDRFGKNANTDITIKSGSWGYVYGSTFGVTGSGVITGNVNITVEGGYIGQLVGTNNEKKPNIVVDGNVNITIKGGKVTNLYASNHNGVASADNKITVTLEKGCYVGKAWGFYYTDKTSNKQPQNATIVYDRTTIFENDIDYFTTVTAVGEGTPPVEPVVIYIGSKSTGKGDGSSPADVMGNSEDYDFLRTLVVALVAQKGGFDKLTSAQKNTAQNVFKMSALYRALSVPEVNLKGATIVLVNDLVLNSTERMEKTAIGEMRLPDSSKHITITSVYNGTDYGAKLVLDNTDVRVNVMFKQDVTFEDLTIEHKYNSSNGVGTDNAAMLSFTGHKVVVGDRVDTIATDVKESAKVDVYPTIVGNHRFSEDAEYINNSTDITVKSGNWGWVYGANYGTYAKTGSGQMNGNVSIVIDGAKVNRLVGTCRDMTLAPYTVDGNVNIHIKSGEVKQLYGSNVNGMTKDTNEITVIIEKGSKVGYAHSYYYLNPINKPKNATITYDRTSVYDEFVKYFTTVNAIGEEPDTVIYVADEAKGTGDGSSPENAMGNAADYAELRAQALELIKNAVSEDGKTKGFDALTAAQRLWISKLYQKSALYRALNEATSRPAKTYIVVVDSLTLNAGERMEINSADALLPDVADHITLTSVYGGVDYRKQGGKLVLDVTEVFTTLMFRCDITFENIDVEHVYNSTRGASHSNAAMMTFTGHKAVIGENVNVTAKDMKAENKVDIFPTLVGNHRYSEGSAYINNNTDITVRSGSWGWIYGTNYGTSKSGIMNGNVNITVEGGYVGQIVGSSKEVSTITTVNGNVTIVVNGGKVAKLYASNHNGVMNESNKIEVTIGKDALVGRAWGFYYTAETADKQPVNSYITYDRAAIISKNVDYFANVTAEGTGEPPVTVIYIADEAKGKGDGSSPENAMGNAADYAALRKEALEKIKTAGGYDNLEAADKNAVSAIYKKTALWRAVNTASKAFGKTVIVVVDELTVSAGSRMESYNNSDFVLPETLNEMTVTSVYGGVDYRKQGAKVVLDITEVRSAVMFNGDTVIENIDFEHIYDSSKIGLTAGYVAMLTFNGHKAVIGDNVNVKATDLKANAKVDVYPAIIGNHRYSEDGIYKYNNTDITVKSGNWGWVYGANYGTGSLGAMEGNVTINIEGGKIGMLVGTCRENATSGYTVTGDVTINVKGGEVVKLYASNNFGVGKEENKINVNVSKGAYVGLAWGFYHTSKTADKQPQNATITYDKTSIFEEDVKYFTTVNAVGEGAPEVHGPVIYISTTSKGTGDGSSPENAMGNAPDYKATYKKALELMASVKDQYNNLSKENQAIVSSVYKKSALYLALSKNNNQIVQEGGHIVICGEYVLDSAEAMRRSFSEFRWPTAGTKRIVITSKYNGVDYRYKGAKFVFDVTNVGIALQTDSPTIWKNIAIEHRYNSANGVGVDNGALIAAAGNAIVMEHSIYSVSTDVARTRAIAETTEFYPSICGGSRYSDVKKDTSITVNGGKWGLIVGGSWSGSHTGNAVIALNGGEVETICGTTRPTNNSSTQVFDGAVWIGLWGGKVGTVYGAAKNGIKWSGVGVAVGPEVEFGTIYDIHPDSEKKLAYATCNFYGDDADKDQIIGFMFATPETGSHFAYYAIIAVVSFAAVAIAVSVKRKKVED